jgi:hypothetical protein
MKTLNPIRCDNAVFPRLSFRIRIASSIRLTKNFLSPTRPAHAVKPTCIRDLKLLA